MRPPAAAAPPCGRCWAGPVVKLRQPGMTSRRSRFRRRAVSRFVSSSTWDRRWTSRYVSMSSREVSSRVWIETRAPHRGDLCQALHPGAPDQVQHHRLRLVGGMVGGGDALGPLSRSAVRRKVVPGHAPGLLQPHAPLTGQGGHIRPLHRQGNVQLPAQLLHKGHVPACRGPLAVVQVGRRHGEIPGMAAR